MSYSHNLCVYVNTIEIRFYKKMSSQDTVKKKYAELPDLEEIIQVFGPDIKKTIKRLAIKYSDIIDEFHLEDIEQIVYLKIIEGRLNTYLGRCTLKHFICGVVVSSIFKDYMRANLKKMREPYSDIEPISDLMQNSRKSGNHTEINVNNIYIQETIENTIRLMPPQRQKIYQMIMVDNLTQKEISEKIGLTQSTISEHWAKIRSELKRNLEAEFPAIFFDNCGGANYGKKIH